MPEIAAPLIAWYRENARDLPWRRPGFSAWGVLVSEFMLQQTPVSRVIPRLEAWLERWPTPEALAADTPAAALREWANLGYPRRALRLYRAAVQMRNQHGGVVPDGLEALLALDGVGDYTARAVAAFAYGQRHPVVDTNTRRVLARSLAGLSQPGPPGRRDLDDMTAVLPEDLEQAAIVNAATMELGAIVCTARSPHCDICPLAHVCAWRNAGYPGTGGTRRPQPRYEGSDRQVRGVILKQLRDAAAHALPMAEVAQAWPDAHQRDRAIDSLVADGLAEASGGELRLPR